MVSQDIRMVAFDCDGTLFSKHGRISEYGLKVLHALRERNIRVVICTGRPLYSIRNTMPEGSYDYAVCENGQTVAKADGTIIDRKRNLNPKEIREITAKCEKYRVMMSCAYDDEFHHFTSRRHHLYVSSIQHLKNIARRMLGRRLWSDDMDSDYARLTNYDISKICFTGMPSVLRKLADSFDSRQYSILFTSPGWLEIQPYGISKGAGLRKLMETENIDREQCAALGDGENDLSMIIEAGTGVAMKNAMSTLKDAADLITEYSCTEDGAVRWVNDHILQNRSENPLFEVK